MKFLHTSDLHIGKRLNGVQLIDDQKYILSQIIKIAEEEKADAIVAAGDIYDKSTPAADYVPVLDDFINEAVKRNIPLLMISGNHDSPERIEFASRLIEKSGVYISGKYNGEIRMYEIKGVEFYLLPYIRPSFARMYYPDEKIENTSLKYENIVVGKILEVNSHPNADTLRVCMVDIGEESPRQIVCGGSNLYVGEYVVISKPGSMVHWHGEEDLVK